MLVTFRFRSIAAPMLRRSIFRNPQDRRLKQRVYDLLTIVRGRTAGILHRFDLPEIGESPFLCSDHDGEHLYDFDTNKSYSAFECFDENDSILQGDEMRKWLSESGETDGSVRGTSAVPPYFPGLKASLAGRQTPQGRLPTTRQLQLSRVGKSSTDKCDNEEQSFLNPYQMLFNVQWVLPKPTILYPTIVSRYFIPSIV